MSAPPNFPVEPASNDGGVFAWDKISGTWKVMFPLLLVGGIIAGAITFSGSVVFQNGVTINNGQLNYTGHISQLPTTTGTLVQLNGTNSWSGNNTFVLNSIHYGATSSTICNNSLLLESSPAFPNARVCFYLGGLGASENLIITPNQTTSQHLNIPNIIQTDTLAVTGEANKINGHSVSFPASNSGTLLLSNGTFAGTLGALLTNTFSYLGHTITIPSNTGTMLLTNGSLSSLTGTLQASTGASTFSNNGHISTLPSTTGTLTQINGTNTWTGANTFSGAVQTNGGLTAAGGATPFTIYNAGGTFFDTFNPASFTSNQAINIPITRETETLAFVPQTNNTSNSTAQTTASTAAYVMSGNWLYITPQITGNIRVSLATIISDGTLGDGCNVKLQYGTGNAPRGGQAVTGSTIGIAISGTSSTASATLPTSIYYPQTGLTQGTRYWIEPAFEAVTGGTCSLTGGMLFVQEY